MNMIAGGTAMHIRMNTVHSHILMSWGRASDIQRIFLIIISDVLFVSILLPSVTLVLQWLA